MSSSSEAVIITILILLGSMLLAGVIVTVAGTADSDLLPTKYDTVVIYNEDMTEVLYSNTSGCEIKDMEGRLAVIINSEEEE